MKKFKKALIILLVIISVFNIQYLMVNAEEPESTLNIIGGFGNQGGGDGNQGGGGGNQGGGDGNQGGGGGNQGGGGGDLGNIHQYPGQFVSPSECSCSGGSCVTNSQIYYKSINVIGNLYDMYNQRYNSEMLKNNKAIAGTAIGVDLYEERSAYWSASSYVVYNCTCSRKGIVGYVTTCSEKYGCTDWPVWGKTYWSYTGYSWSSSCQAQANREGYNKAKDYVEKDGASYSLNISDPNDARCANPDKYSYELKRDGVICNNYKVSAVPGTVTSYEESLKSNGKVTQKYHYEMYGACINAKTGKVRYLNEGDICGSEEYYIENDNENENTRHWHVFTPLNTKSTDGYKLILSPNTNTIQSGGICQSIVENYANNNEYELYIKPISGSFVGDISTDKQKVKNGCYFHTILDIKIDQKYYNEEINGSESTLQGFNFYYRPIDIDNPFPNGIASDSYWKIWEENGKKDPDISKSYDEYTYVTNMDEDEIKEYNDEIEYTDWSNMNIDGSSQFIQSSQTIIRNGKITNDSFYSLGCGPQNQCEYLDSDHTVENPIYQPECSVIRLGDVCP